MPAMTEQNERPQTTMSNPFLNVLMFASLLAGVAGAVMHVSNSATIDVLGNVDAGDPMLAATGLALFSAGLLGLVVWAGASAICWAIQRS